MAKKNIKKEIVNLVNSLRMNYQKKINNTYIWFSVSHDAIGALRFDEDLLNKSKISVPSFQKGKKVNRNKEDIISVLNNAYDKEFLQTIFSHLTSQMESFFYDLIEGVLLIDNRRIKIKSNKIKLMESLNVETILNSENYSSVIKKIIDANLISVFYASPEKQLEYINQIFSISNDEKLEIYIKKWKEFKAARDIIIHNNGIINEVYISKAGEYARGKCGEELIIQKLDIEDLVKHLKSIIGKLCSSIKNENTDKTDKTAQVSKAENN